MSLSALRELIDERTILMPYTVGQYHEMIAIRILPEGEPYELLDGYVVRKDRSAVGGDPTTVGTEHAWVLAALNELNPKLGRQQCHLRIQQPVTIPKYNEPEPDGAIVGGNKDDYRERHPGSEDTLCVIEVADASLRRDRTTKLRIYADSGIPQYVIINLLDRVIEVYTDPLVGKGRYAQATTLKAGQQVSFPTTTGKRITASSRQLLP